MHEHENINVVGDFFDAWDHGDLERMLGALADDVEWVMPGTADVVPHLGRHEGRDAVAKLMQSIADHEELLGFERHDVLAKGNLVVVLGHERLRVKSTGAPCAFDLVHVFELEGGKIVQAQTYFDAALLVDAYQPAASTAPEAEAP